MTSDEPTYTQLPQQITTPAVVESRLGDLRFDDGYPDANTVSLLQDELDYLHGVEAFTNSIQGVSVWAIRKGFAAAGIADNEFILFSELMDAKSLFLTANADTVYFWGNLNLSNGPMVVETPPNTLGVMDDLWFRWIGDFGLPGPDRGQGGHYLVVPPGYDGPLPEGGFFVYHSRTTLITILGRAFLQDNDPAPAVANIREHLKVYPYAAGGFGTSVGGYLSGAAPLAAPATPRAPRFIEGSGLEMNTIPPNDFDHYVLLDEMVQHEPVEALDVELAGQFAAIGIRKGEEFAPSARLRAILERSVAVGNAAGRMIGMGAHPTDHWRYYDESSAWWNPLFEGGYEFLTAPPDISPDGTVVPRQNPGARLINSRLAMFYVATGVTPAMCMRLTNVGSQYLVSGVDSVGAPFDGSKTYRMVLPPDIPAGKFWSTTLYDNQSRSMLQTPQRYPRAGSQSYPSPAAAQEADSSVHIYFAPTCPPGVERGNWVQTDPAKGWFQILRFYSPLQHFFDKTWRAGDVELVN